MCPTGAPEDVGGRLVEDDPVSLVRGEEEAGVMQVGQTVEETEMELPEVERVEDNVDVGVEKDCEFVLDPNVKVDNKVGRVVVAVRFAGFEVVVP